MIEATASGSGGRDHETVENAAAPLVLIEPVAHELAQEPAALRVPIPNYPAERGSVLAQRSNLAAVFQIRSEIADSRQPEPGNRGIFGLVNRFVQACLESPVERHRAAVSSEAPLLPIDDSCRFVDFETESKLGGFVFRIGGAIGQRKGVPQRRSVFHVTFAHQSFYRCRRSVESQPAPFRDVELPPEKRDRETLFEQKTIAEVPVFRRRIAAAGAAEQKQRLRPAAIDYFQEDCAARFARLGAHDEKITGKLHLP